MDNKKLLGALGILAVIIVIVLVLALPKSNLLSNVPLSVEAQPTGPKVVAQVPLDGQRLDTTNPRRFRFNLTRIWINPRRATHSRCSIMGELFLVN